MTKVSYEFTCDKCGVTLVGPSWSGGSKAATESLAFNAGWARTRMNQNEAWVWQCQKHREGVRGNSPDGFLACVLCGDQIASPDQKAQNAISMNDWLKKQGWNNHPLSGGYICPKHEVSWTPSGFIACISCGDQLKLAAFGGNAIEQLSRAKWTLAAEGWTCPKHVISLPPEAVVCALCDHLDYPPNPSEAAAWLRSAGWIECGPNHWICERHYPAPFEIKKSIAAALSSSGRWKCSDCDESGFFGSFDYVEHKCWFVGGKTRDSFVYRYFSRPASKIPQPTSLDPIRCARCDNTSFPIPPGRGDRWFISAGWRKDHFGAWICPRHRPKTPSLDVPDNQQSITQAVLDEVEHERQKQDAKWGLQNHDAQFWTVIETEELGEVAKAVFEETNSKDHLYSAYWTAEYRKEMIQVAAVAVAAIESLDRQRR